MRTRTSGAAVDGVWTSGVAGEGRGPGGHGLDGVLEQDHRLVGGGGVAGEQAGAEPELHPAFQVDAVDLDEPGADGGGEVQQQHPHRRRLARPGTARRQRRHGDRDPPRLPVLGDTHLRRGDGGCQVRGREPGLHHRRERVGEQEPERAPVWVSLGMIRICRDPTVVRSRSDAATRSSTVCPTISCGTTTSTSGSSHRLRPQGRRVEFGAVLADHPPSEPGSLHQRRPGPLHRPPNATPPRRMHHEAEVGGRPAPGPQRRHHGHARPARSGEARSDGGSRRPCLPSRPAHELVPGAGTGARRRSTTTPRRGRAGCHARSTGAR